MSAAASVADEEEEDLAVSAPLGSDVRAVVAPRRPPGAHFLDIYLARDKPMAVCLWRNIIITHLKSGQPADRFLQLATVRPDGRPAVRTVVFRGFLDDRELLFCTDTRSRKVGELRSRSDAEVCWYFGASREQFRITGGLTLITAETMDERAARARVAVWKGLSVGGRTQFAWPEPGLPRMGDPGLFVPHPPSTDAPLPTFALLMMDADEVDHLSLATNQRTIHSRVDRRVRLNPRAESDGPRATHSDEPEHWVSNAVNP